uniref:Probable thiopurine S-methyltransferase n=1 Tax=Sinocyclocheilus anshuiensis TaxID=1608454 RepID=A0A671N7U9_9TELE
RREEKRREEKRREEKMSAQANRVMALSEWKRKEGKTDYLKAASHADGKISIYQCDLYKFSSAVAGKFGGIWDRGALVAINPCDRRKYATLLMSLMNNDCRYLLDTVEYNSELYKGPPFFVSEEDVKNEFGGGCDIELLESVDAFGEKYKSWGLDSLIEEVYLLTLKAH